MTLVVGLGIAPSCSSGTAYPQADTPNFSPAPHAPFPTVPSGGGPTLARPKLVLLTFAGDVQSGELASFVEWLAGSSWLSTVAGEYGVEGLAGVERRTIGGAAPRFATDADLADLLAAYLGTSAESSALYLVALPDGSVLARGGVDVCKSSTGGGYHDTLDGAPGRPPFVALPRCPPTESALLSPSAATEAGVARFVVNALTDPSPRNEPAYALTDDAEPWSVMGSEVGDLCWGRLVDAGDGHTLQRVWSNRAAEAGGDPCAPSPGGEVFFGVTTAPGGLREASVGVPFTLSVTGWSSSPLTPWSLRVHPWSGEFPVEASLDRATIGNGEKATLRVAIPDAVARGAHGSVLLQASRAGSDAYAWPVAFVIR